MSRSLRLAAVRPKSAPPVFRPGGGRIWWAHIDYTRINIALTIVKKDIEDFLDVAVFALRVEEFDLRRSLVGLPRSLEVAADLAELPESPVTGIDQQESPLANQRTKVSGQRRPTHAPGSRIPAPVCGERAPMPPHHSGGRDNLQRLPPVWPDRSRAASRAADRSDGGAVVSK